MRGLDDDAFMALYDARAETLQTFFDRRAPNVRVAIALWADTLAHARVIAHRFRGESPEEAAAWLEAIAYRRLARYRDRRAVESSSLRRLGIAPPPEDPDQAIGAFRSALFGVDCRE